MGRIANQFGWRQEDDKYNLNYRDPSKPVGLPLEEVWLNVPISPDNLAVGQTWPPQHTQSRVERMNAQHAASRGDFTTWMPYADLEVSLNPIGWYKEEVRAILMASAPAEDEDPLLRKAIRHAIGKAADNMIDHGRAIIIGAADAVTVPEIRYSWPFEDGGWAVVRPQVSSDENSNGRPDYVVIDIWDGTQLSSFTVKLEGTVDASVTGVLGETVDQLPAEPMQLAVADRPALENGWGTPHTDDLIPLAVAMARRESGIDYTLEHNERPLFQIKRNNADKMPPRTGAPKDGYQTTESSVESLRQQSPTVRSLNVLELADGYKSGEYATWSSPMEASFKYLDRLDMQWTRSTGSPPVEAADAGNVMSGIALARRRVLLVAKCRELHEAIYDGIATVLGRDFEWPYVDTILGDVDDEEEEEESQPGGEV